MSPHSSALILTQTNWIPLISHEFISLLVPLCQFTFLLLLLFLNPNLFGLGALIYSK